MKIGLFFGTFNPIHIGHLVIANYFTEFTDLNKVWFVVSPHNPMKEKKSLLNEKQRLYMVNLAIEEEPKFKASSVEFHLPRPSYTIDTLTYLKEKYPKHDFVLIMGSDNLESFHQWKNYEQILKQYQVYVYKRRGAQGKQLANHPSVKIFDVPLLDISASFIRQSIRDGKKLRFFFPDNVFKYIEEMNLYKD